MEQDFHGEPLVCFQVDQQHKNVLTDSLINAVISWYHFIMGHAGINQMAKCLNAFLYYLTMKSKVEAYVTMCNACQLNKNLGLGYGYMTPSQDISQPWEEVAVDCIGLWMTDFTNLG